MTASPSHHDVMRDGFWITVASHSDAHWLGTIVVAVGLSWSVAFVAIGLGYQLELFGDGSIFSYAVAVDEKRRSRGDVPHPLAQHLGSRIHLPVFYPAGRGLCRADQGRARRDCPVWTASFCGPFTWSPRHFRG